MTPEQLDALWQDYCEAASPSGSTENGAIDLYDIEGMDDAAHELYQQCKAALAASEARAAGMREAAACVPGLGLTWTAAQRMIRALTDADADAALAARDKRVREDALRCNSPIASLLPDAIARAEKAMRKFPQPNYVISKWAEETGEVTKALIHLAEGRLDPADLRYEIVDSLAMLHRLLVEGDQVHGLPPVAALIDNESGL